MPENKCPSCAGEGKVSCQGCSGTGKKGGPTTKEDLKKSWTACASCHGRGTIQCKACNGSGKI